MPLYARQALLSFGRAIDGPGHSSKVFNSSLAAASEDESWVNDSCCISMSGHDIRIHLAAAISVIFAVLFLLGFLILLVLAKCNRIDSIIPTWMRPNSLRKQKLQQSHCRTVSKDNSPPPSYDYVYEYEYHKDGLKRTYNVDHSFFKDASVVYVQISDE